MLVSDCIPIDEVNELYIRVWIKTYLETTPAHVQEGKQDEEQLYRDVHRALTVNMLISLKEKNTSTFQLHYVKYVFFVRRGKLDTMV